MNRWVNRDLQIDNYLRKELVKDLRHCADRIMEERDPRRKLLFFEQCGSMAGSILELNYDKQLNFIQFTLEISAKAISLRTEVIFGEENETIPLVEDLFSRLAEALNELAAKIEKDEEPYKTLEEIVQLTYLTTEAGYYQHQKGQIRL